MFINVFIPSKDQTNKKSKSYIIILLLFVILPFMVMQIYSLNCMVTGECHAWSWTLSVIAAIFTFLYVIGFIAMIMKIKKNS
jgi:NADH:ubiquinone oxidoreductase subunit 3 (subunit A)